jgi:hypothetical protein
MRNHTVTLNMKFHLTLNTHPHFPRSEMYIEAQPASPLHPPPGVRHTTPAKIGSSVGTRHSSARNWRPWVPNGSNFSQIRHDSCVDDLREEAAARKPGHVDEDGRNVRNVRMFFNVYYFCVLFVCMLRVYVCVCVCAGVCVYTRDCACYGLANIHRYMHTFIHTQAFSEAII